MKKKEINWVLLTILLSLGWLLAYANRTALAPILRVLERVWSLNKTQLGLLNSAFYLLYAVMQLPAGSLCDTYGRRKVLIPGFLLHSIGAIGSGIASNFGTFLTMRSITGFSQGTYFSAQQATTNAFTPKNRRSVGAAIIQTGCSLGVAFGSIMSGLLVFRWGFHWRVPFLVLGVLTLLLTVAYYLLVPESKLLTTEKKHLNGAEKYHIDRNMMLLLVVGFCTMYGFFVLITWLPYYLETVRGFSGEQAGFIATIMPLVTIPSALLFGYLADRSGNRKTLILALIPVAATAIVLVPLGNSNLLLYAGLFLYGVGGKLVIDPMLVTIIANNVNPKFYGKAYGLLNFAHAAGMVAAPTLTGYIVDVGGSFNSAFYFALLLQVIAFVSLLLVKTERH